MKTTEFLNLPVSSNLLLHTPLGIIRVSTIDTVKLWAPSFSNNIRHYVMLKFLEPGISERKHKLQLSKQRRTFTLSYEDAHHTYYLPVYSIEITRLYRAKIHR